MTPSDWVADCMVPDAWQHQPFSLDGEIVVCDGSALIAFPACTEDHPPPRFGIDQDCSEHLKKSLDTARIAETAPAGDIKSLGLNEQYTTRLLAEKGLEVLVGASLVFIRVVDTTTGELEAYGVIFKGGQGA